MNANKILAALAFSSAAQLERFVSALAAPPTQRELAEWRERDAARVAWVPRPGARVVDADGFYGRVLKISGTLALVDFSAHGKVFVPCDTLRMAD